MPGCPYKSMVCNQQRHTLSKVWSTVGYQQWDKSDIVLLLIDKWTMLFFSFLDTYVYHEENKLHSMKLKKRDFSWEPDMALVQYFLPHNPEGRLETSSYLLHLPLSSYQWTVHLSIYNVVHYHILLVISMEC